MLLRVKGFIGHIGSAAVGEVWESSMLWVGGMGVQVGGSVGKLARGEVNGLYGSINRPLLYMCTW